jgi:transcriptional regulator with XRE-family HTH domain
MTAGDLLRQRVEASSQAVVARELGVSKSAISQLLSGKYGASTAKLDARIMTMFGGQKGAFVCPHTNEEINPIDCAETWELATAAGRRVPGNPVTLRQYHACRNCEIRK